MYNPNPQLPELTEQDQIPAYCSQGWNFLYKTLFSPNTADKQMKGHTISKPSTVVNIPVE